MKGLAVVMAAAITSCGRQERVALAPYPPSTPTGIAVPMEATVLCDTSGAAWIYTPSHANARGAIDLHWSDKFGVNDSLLIIFGDQRFRLYSHTTLSMRRLGKGER